MKRSGEASPLLFHSLGTVFINTRIIAKGKVASLPDGEAKPDPSASSGQVVDILIILGQSYVGDATPTPTP